MLTSNGVKYLWECLTKYKSSSSNDSNKKALRTEYGTYKDVAGGNIPTTGNPQQGLIFVMKSYNDVLNDDSADKPFCIVVGSNPETESRSDYAWDNNIDNLKCVSFNGCLIEDDAICLSASFVNLTNEDITVNEVGMIARVYANLTTAKPVLLAREVYKEPITVKANGGAQTFGLRLR